jgi:hypothetical protein
MFRTQGHLLLSTPRHLIFRTPYIQVTHHHNTSYSGHFILRPLGHHLFKTPGHLIIWGTHFLLRTPHQDTTYLGHQDPTFRAPAMHISHHIQDTSHISHSGHLTPQPHVQETSYSGTPKTHQCRSRNQQVLNMVTLYGELTLFSESSQPLSWFLRRLWKLCPFINSHDTCQESTDFTLIPIPGTKCY